MSDAQNKNLWGGRFTGETDRGFADYNRSFGFDRRLFAVDVRGSIAHCDGLAGAGVLTDAESNEIKSALQAVDSETARRMVAEVDALLENVFASSKFG